MTRDSWTSDEFASFLEVEAPRAAEDLARLAAESRGKRADVSEALRGRLSDRWTEGWALLDSLVFAMQQNGALMLQRSEQSKDDDHSPIRDAMMLIHCAGTITLQEIGTLASNGLWAGAAARWRGLHELAVTARVIGAQNRVIAERYFDHSYVVQTRRLRDYYEEHGRSPISADELEKRTSETSRLVEKNRDPDQAVEFGAAYGWAIPLMGMSTKGKRLPPTLGRLEELAEMTDRRLLVASAHGLVHNDSAGIAASVLVGDGNWALGPHELFIETVMRPTFNTLIHLIAATHLGFENELNEFAKSISVLAAGCLKLAADGVRVFESSSTNASAP